MRTSLLADYPCFDERWCFTLVRGVHPLGVVRRLGGLNVTRRAGVDEIAEAHGDLGRSDARVVGVTAAGDWALLVDVAGWAGSPAILSLSAGTTVVSCSRTINAAAWFTLAEDGERQLAFDPGCPRHAAGTRPEEYADAFHRVGMDRTGDDRPYGGALALALAETLTGVRLTHELLAARWWSAEVTS